MTLYSLKNVSHVYPEAASAKSLDNISLEIVKGDFIALTGTVGSGKSTFLKLLVGLLKPSSGQILFNGNPIPAKGSGLWDLRKRVGISFQFPDNQIFEATVYDEVAFGLKNYDFPEGIIESRIQSSLDLAGLDYNEFADKSPFELSGGERKRLALASIMALEPELLLLDEPTSGVDAAGKKSLIKSLLEVKDSGRGSLIVTHDLDFAAELCERVVVLHAGKLVYNGSREIFFDPELLRQYKLDTPEFVAEWKKLQNEGRIPIEKVYSLTDAFKILD